MKRFFWMAVGWVISIGLVFYFGAVAGIIGQAGNLPASARPSIGEALSAFLNKQPPDRMISYYVGKQVQAETVMHRATGGTKGEQSVIFIPRAPRPYTHREIRNEFDDWLRSNPKAKIVQVTVTLAKTSAKPDQ